MKRIYATVNFKQFFICFFAGFLAVSAVICLDIFYLTSKASATKSNLPVIIIDPGHGGEDGGASSADGIVEKDINLKISLKVNELLKIFGFETKLIRSGDYMIYDSTAQSIREKKVSDIHNRMKILESTPNSIFLSIHQNHYSSSKYSGAQVFYSGSDVTSKIIAESLQSTIIEKLQPNNTRKVKKCGTEIYLLYHSKTPAVMVECGFLSNYSEAQNLNDDAYQKKMALAIVSGIINYLNVN